MSTAVSNMVSGRYVSTGAALNINLGFLPSKFELFNITNQSSSANPGVVKKAVWMEPMLNGQALVVSNTSGAATDQSSIISSGGISLFDSSDQSLEAPKTITAITNASPAVVTSASHGYAIGDVVRIYGTTAMQQIAGMDFEITAVTSNTFTLNLNASGFAAAASAGFARRHKSSPVYVPRRRFIVSASQASNAVIQTSISHGYKTGEYVRLNIPSDFGMSQMSGLLGKVTYISQFSFSVDIDSSSFTAFAFPASASVPFTFAEVVPVGSHALGAQVSTDPWNAIYVPGATDNVGFQGVNLGVSVVGAASDVVLWMAYKSDLYVNMN